MDVVHVPRGTEVSWETICSWSSPLLLLLSSSVIIPGAILLTPLPPWLPGDPMFVLIAKRSIDSAQSDLNDLET